MDFILETLGKVGFEWRMGLFSLINFLIVFWILKKFFFKTVVDTVNERQKKIQDGIDNFQKAKTELEMSESKAKEIIAQAKREADGIVEAAHTSAKETAAQMREKAKGEIKELVAHAKEGIKKEKQAISEDVKRESAALVVAIAEKILGEKVGQDIDEKYIHSMLKKT